MAANARKFAAAAFLLAAVVAVGAIMTPKSDDAFEEGAGVIEKIKASEARDMMVSNETVVFDVRTLEEYATGHIVNARLLTLDAIDGQSAAEVAPDKTAPVLVYCRSGVRSAEAARKLAALGYEQVYDFGGIIDWPYDTVVGEEEVAESGLAADQLPVGVKVVCGQTKSIPREQEED
ncbi:rhodanese-like domain-containing protein [Adlercreutzia sp. R21]|uniref:Rhodanese-like domain-containing protein n=1 Tax=Adlercreutzia wanghongyangiae TaxID=3111451 RepID=A0ABU6IGC6_9ACTN|nr:rhodanese-like domain-containing protein [Adlercreutzia sp. R21]MEC4175501.1 rhodanese-like domain-containing protein [Adlercreutzia sp. R7]MEC4183355.1 rhodanese-like domain-containing protein [Adlercreutzia sp. R21]